LRFGLDLSPEEKVFLRQRRPKVLSGLASFLNADEGPESLSEVRLFDYAFIRKCIFILARAQIMWF
jgi:hypothetical protein